MAWDKIADQNSIDAAVKALGANGFSVIVAENAAAAKEKALEIIPKGSEVFTVSSATVDSIGLSKEINESGNYDALRNKIYGMDREKQRKEMVQLGSSPDWVVGSVHAITEDGKVLVASASGSQLPAYVYGAPHVVWIVGTQKIVKDLDQGMKRVYDYTLPLESERAKKAYGVPGSVVAKLLIFNREVVKDRTTIILVKENLGF